MYGESELGFGIQKVDDEMKLRFLKWEITIGKRTDCAFCGEENASDTCEFCGRRFCGNCYPAGQPYGDIVVCQDCIGGAQETAYAEAEREAQELVAHQ